MSTRIRLVALVATLAAIALLGACGGAEQAAPSIDPLVTAEWLAEHLDDPDLVILDCTVLVEFGPDMEILHHSGYERYAAGHVPGAGFADLIHDLSAPDSPLNFAMPTPERFCEAMGALGVGDGKTVVLYDSYNSVWASRVWWMLRWVGFDDAAILDGGWGAWTEGMHPESVTPADDPVATLTPRLRPELVAEYAEVRAAMDDPDVVLIDAMPEPHYLGQMELYERPGHIPGAVNVPVLALFDDAEHFRPLEELAAMHAGDPAARTITYCGAGFAASANAFVLHRLGFTDVAVYMASLQEWAADPANPLTVEAAGADDPGAP